MKVSHYLFAAAVMIAAAIGGTSQAKAQGIHLHATLVGGNEVGGGDPDGYGTVALQFQSTASLCISILVSRIGTPTMAHIHRGFGSVNGPIVVPLTAPPAGNPGGTNECVTISSTLYNEIRTNPYSFYVNVHTSDFPGGAIRGQLF